MLEFIFKQASCVVVGTFNIYIVQPKLLTEMSVLQKADAPTVVSGDLTQPGIRFFAEDANWIVRPDRLAVESRKHTVDCGRYVAKTLEALKWTPIMAVGTNMVFHADNSRVEEMSGALRLPTYEGAKQRTSHVSIPHRDAILNVQLSHTDELELSINIHTDLSAFKNDQKALNAQARSACESFLSQREDSVCLAAKLVNGELKYE